ncbi:hypothetical protein SRABI128_05940 [Microbacterium sp. Bi128]|nr:hypothetical protein SRABI128_05940 [Microbacterium sp. Bi128]
MRVAVGPERGGRGGADGRNDFEGEALEDFQLLGEGQCGGQRDGLQVVAVERVVAEDLVDHLLRAAHQGRTVGDGVVDVPVGGVVAGNVPAGREGLVDRAELPLGLLRGVRDEHPARARSGAQVLVPGIVAVARVFLAVVVNEHLVVFPRLDRVGREQRIAPLRRQRRRGQAGGGAVPDPRRPGEGPRRRGGGLGQRGAEPPGPRDVFLGPQLAEQGIFLREELPLVRQVQAEQRVLQHLIALADHQFQPAAAELVDRGVVLGDPHRVQHGQHRHAALQPDPGGDGGDGGEHGGGGGGDELTRVAFPDGEAVVAEALRPARGLHHLVEPVRGGDDLPGDRVLQVRDDVEDLEPHWVFPAGAGPKLPSVTVVDSGRASSESPQRSRTLA